MRAQRKRGNAKPAVVIDVRCVHPGMTGIGRYAMNLVHSLDTLESPIKAIALVGDGGAEALTGLIRMRVDRLDADASLRTFLQKVHPRIWHSPFFVIPPEVDCPCIATLHDVIPLARPDVTPAQFVEMFREHVPARLKSASVVTVSEYSRHDIHRFFPELRVEVVPEAVSPVFGLLNGARSPSSTANRPYLLCVGALDRRKNLSALFEALSFLRDSWGLRAPLAVVGGPSGDGYDGPGEARRRGVEDQVRFLGRVPDAELAALYRGATAMVFPSLYEGFGLPVIEAMACGTPVVASQATSVPEAAGNAAILVNPEEPREIAAAIRHVMQDEGLRRVRFPPFFGQVAKQRF